MTGGCQSLKPPLTPHRVAGMIALAGQAGTTVAGFLTGDSCPPEVGLMEFEQHIDRFNENVIIYSDVDHINHIFSSQVTFKVDSIKQQKSLIQLLNLKRSENPELNISLEYLLIDLKNYNPFAKSAHNAARKLLNMPTSSFCR